MTEYIKPNFSNSDVLKMWPTISISQLLDMLSKPFDQDGVATRTFEKHFNDPSSKYYKKTKDEILRMWGEKGQESMRYGSLLDDYIGARLTKTDDEVRLYKLNNNYDYDERLRGLCDSFDHFYDVLNKSGDTKFVDREQQVYYTMSVPNPDNHNEQITYNLRGRFDALFYNKRTNKWIVIDWKSSGTIDTRRTPWTENLLGPMNKYPALNWYTYTTQLYFYKKVLIEREYLPKGTLYDDVMVMIVNLPGKTIKEYGKDWNIFKPAYEFDTDLMNKLFRFGIEKDYIIKKAGAIAKNVEENKEERLEKLDEIKEDLTSIF